MTDLPRAPHDLTHLRSFMGKWVALDERNRVCGVGHSLNQAFTEATTRGYHKPTMYLVGDDPHV